MKELTITIQDLFEFYFAYPEYEGLVEVETRYGYYPVEKCCITAYNSPVIELITEDNKRLLTTKLPQEVNGSYWITDFNNKNLVNIEAKDGKWILNNNFDIKILSNGENSDSINLLDANKLTSVELSIYSSGILYDITNGIEYKYF